MGNNKSLKDKLNEITDETNEQVEAGNPVMWHRIIMAVTTALAGLILLVGLMINHLNEKQVMALNERSVVDSDGSRVLPAGDYYIYRVFLDPALRTHYIVTSMKGGALVSVVPPQNTPEPENIIPIIRYDSAAYVIRVDNDGAWSFLPTSVLKGILEKMQEIPDDATFRAQYNLEQKNVKNEQNPHTVQVEQVNNGGQAQIPQKNPVQNTQNER